ncbi:MAG: 5-formyltetrahydrofolate cyclo-ligase [Saprospiraceae bacterium]|nr:5-formyltetrahydrofolate cyclo-ligase [Saprospiraceae bacterium]
MKEIRDQKAELRAQLEAGRQQLSRADRNRFAEHICQTLWDLIQEREVKVVHSFLTMGKEVNVLPLLQRLLDVGITVVAPKTLRKRQMTHLVVHSMQDMELGVFGTYHPRESIVYQGRYDLIIVAGLAFEKAGYRLGYGGGYYDTFLADHPEAWKVGVGYPFQLLDEVPVEAHDICLDQVIIPEL